MVEEERGLDLPVSSDRRAVGQFARYFLVSLVGFAADIGLFWLFNDIFAVHHLIANPISFAVGATTVYLGSVWWVFDVRRVKNRALEFAAFVSVGILGLMVNELALWACVELVGLNPVPAKLPAAGGSFLFNFVVRKVALFR